ncbi:histidinol-phosphatase HisJ family protein [Lachnospiraceae bacterium 62-35]
MLADFHIHTLFSGDSQVPVREQLDRALQMGMRELCITDHNDYCVDSGEIDFNLDFEAYVSSLQRLKKEYEGQLRLNVGLEMGLQPFLSQYCHEIALRYPFDFIIGSVHFINGKDPYYPEYFQERSTEDAYMEYFQAVLSCVECCDAFDVLGHLDYVIRYGPQRIFHPEQEPFSSIIRQILTILIQKGKGLECNTCGFRYGMEQPNPSAYILKEYRKMGGEIITIGSDAHESGQIGSYFSETAKLLKECGFSSYTVFHNRTPIFTAL